MRVLVVSNPIAGAGHAARVAGEIAQEVGDAGHEVVAVASQLEPAAEWLTPAAAQADVVVVVGGDGAVRQAAAAMPAGVALYHYPAGTENLFAREFGARADPSQLVAALGRDEVVQVDLGDVDGETFVLMASAGFDAEVIADLAAHRTGAISHRTYVVPIIRQLVRWRSPILTIRVDGSTLVERSAGTVVIANCRQYAMRLDVARYASMRDGQLDVVFLPATTRRSIIAWMLRCRRGRHLDHPGVAQQSGRRVEVEAERPFSLQVDGDTAPATDHLDIRVRPNALAGLIP